jgi:tRNA 2-selenouridine synthase
MKLILDSLSDLAASDFDEIIDVRSPSEYAEDHLPGAVNLPVLDDVERAEVGTVYVQDSRFRARRLGAAHVARNAARHLETHLKDRDGSYRPLVYCWRGGMRSGSFATILEQVGWRVSLLDGGYQAYRRLVHKVLYEQPLSAPVVVLDGNTGTAKTDLLAILAARGRQVIDLEGLANHRGSVFGARPGGQPGQKAFESRLAMALVRLDPALPVLVEAESSKIGNRAIPPTLWSVMRGAPRIFLSAPLDERARYLARAYADVAADADALVAVIDKLTGLQANELLDRWRDLARSGAHAELARDLMEVHYDPRYLKQRSRAEGGEETVLEIGDLSETGLATAADRLEALLDRMAG